MRAKVEARKIWPKVGPLIVAGVLASAVTAFAASDGPKKPTAPPPLPRLAETLRFLATTDHLADPAYPTASFFPPRHALAPIFTAGPGFLAAPTYDKAVAVAAWAPTTGTLHEELTCLALNVYFEARGEPAIGKAAVAHVTMNRAASNRFPETICKVIRQGGEARLNRCQFSWWCDGRSDQPLNRRSWEQAREIAHDVYWNVVSDPTAGALWYHADYVKPYWARAFAKGPRIGQHLFYLDKRSRTQVASKS